MYNAYKVFFGVVYFISTIVAIQPMNGFNEIRSKQHLLTTYLKCLVWPICFVLWILMSIVRSWADLPDTDKNKDKSNDLTE